MKRNLKVITITFVAFAIYFIIDESFFKILRTNFNHLIGQFGVSHNLAYLVVGIPIFAAVYLLHRKENAFQSMGLDKSFFKAMLFALICTSPMLIGYAVFFDLSTEYTLDQFLISAVAAAFFEELYFRGFLFGQVFRYSNWGFITAVLAGAILFGLIHLYQGSSLDELIGIFLVTFAGAILFAWVYAEWEFNIWVPVFLHFFMNLFWDIFSAGENALGGINANLFRFISIFLVIGLTVVYKIKTGGKMRINKNNLILKKNFQN